MTYLSLDEVKRPIDQASPLSMLVEFAGVFSSRFALSKSAMDSSPLDLVSFETLITEKACARYPGRIDPYPEVDRQSIIERPHRWYAVLGLSSGTQATHELVRGLEAQVERQVKRR